MKERIREILIEVNEDISDYTGDNFFDDGLLDSLSIADVIGELNEEFKIEITAKYVTEENFKNIDSITKLVEKLKLQ